MNLNSAGSFSSMGGSYSRFLLCLARSCPCVAKMCGFNYASMSVPDTKALPQGKDELTFMDRLKKSDDSLESKRKHKLLYSQLTVLLLSFVCGCPLRQYVIGLSSNSVEFEACLRLVHMDGSPIPPLSLDVLEEQKVVVDSDGCAQGTLDEQVYLMVKVCVLVSFLMAVFFYVVQFCLWWDNRMAALGSAVFSVVFANVNTSLGVFHFVTLGICFFVAIFVPSVFLAYRGDKKEAKIITFQFLPTEFQWIDLFYTVISIPLSYLLVDRLYFHYLSAEVPWNWPASRGAAEDLAYDFDRKTQLMKLFCGINLVGIWDELFFINVVFALLLDMFPFMVANCAQSVIYCGVLYDMAFRGYGWFLVYLFALTQGAMYYRTRSLLWVLIVHLIVDFFLFKAIVGIHYPETEGLWNFEIFNPK